ncbi:hypothetical protein GOEFS_086_00470 [Gordonia effusa NBRC 100432]|uniref:Beta-lactamase class A catalytic domain-containing protein n=1 Tax=Gordonia effusa NBRC 100432 TaxID=1077974 RepID=H0R326_9ACTN|nr:serine hydrolase [Gordonia effusa]GAB19477.1 hypothetical protein GOEFS_086_00470 [Gordonia effusa NBRC 100432]
MVDDSTLDDHVAHTFADAGCAGWVHARTLNESGVEYGYRPDAPVVLASVYKLPLMISLCRMADRNDIDLAERVTVTPHDVAEGATGLSVLHDPVTMSWRDLCVSMMTVSDNAAADVVLGRVGLHQLAADLADLSLSHTRIVSGMREVHARLRAETGTSTVAEAFEALANPDVEAEVSAYDAAYASAGTPRECTTLLDAVWRDVAASPDSCDFIRRTMRKQVFTTRIASGLAVPHATVAGKTGTIGSIRNEIAVVEFPGESSVAIAIFTKSARAAASLPTVDRAIGEVARAVVMALRRPLV